MDGVLVGLLVGEERKRRLEDWGAKLRQADRDAVEEDVVKVQLRERAEHRFDRLRRLEVDQQVGRVHRRPTAVDVVEEVEEARDDRRRQGENLGADPATHSLLGLLDGLEPALVDLDLHFVRREPAVLRPQVVRRALAD